MTDWATPTLSTSYSGFLSALLARDVDAATQFTQSTPTNIPNGAIRWNAATYRWEQYSTGSSTWTAWAANLAVYAVTLGADPTAALQAATKQYVDAAKAAAIAGALPSGGGTLTGSVQLSNGSLGVQYTAGGAAVVLGNYTVAGSVVMDFTTAATSTYNVRFTASGGSIAAGSGALNIQANGGLSFSVRPTWASWTPWDSNNLPTPVPAGSYGTWNSTLTTASDLSAITVAGWYQWISTSTNAPAAGSAGIVQVLSTSGTNATPAAGALVVQFATQSNGNLWSRRNLNAGGWSAWGQVADSNSLSSLMTSAEVTTALGYTPSRALFGTVTNATGSRVIGTTYTNAGSLPVFVSVSAYPASGNATLYLYINGNLVTEMATVAAGAAVLVCAIVPPGATYAAQISSGSWTIARWTETA